MSARQIRLVHGGIARVAGAMSFAIVAAAMQAAFASEPPATTQPEKTAEKIATEDHHAAQFGVLVAATPGNGVLVVDVAPHSPADTSGLEPGDYLLSIDGKAVASPEELRKLIQAKQPGAHVEASVWRQGKTMQREITLAAKSAEVAEDRDKAWLGVVLQAGDQPGAPIELVHPLGPAKQAGLRRGDVIVQIDGKKVSSVEDAVAQIEKLKPHATVNIVVLRNGKEETIKVTLDNASEALSGLPHHALRPFGWADGLGHFDLGDVDWMAEEHAQFKEMIQQLRDEVAELRRESRSLPEKGAGKKSKDQEGSIRPEKSPNPSVSPNPGSNDDPSPAPVAKNSSQGGLTPPSGYYLAQYAPYYRYPAPRIRYYYRYPAPPPPYPYSYYYYQGAPYYYSYRPPYAYPYSYPYATPYYYGPGVTVRVGPYVYFQRWR